MIHATYKSTICKNLNLNLLTLWCWKWYSTLKFELPTNGAHVHACKLSRHWIFGGSIVPWRVPSPSSLGPVERRNNFDTAPFISHCELTDEFVVAKNTLASEIYKDRGGLTKNLVCERTVQTERPLLVGEVSANFCG
jgi:hypothetical protein